MKLGRAVFYIFCSGLVVLMFERTAYAYLDPGTGSMVFQALLAVFVGTLAAVKVYWSRIKRFLPGQNRQDSNPEETN